MSPNLVQPLELRMLLSAGDLDSAFASNGEFQSGFGAHAVFHDVAVQSDGKIVAVGAVDPEKNHPKVLVARFTASGKLDKTFSGDGFDVTTLSGHGTVAYKLLMLDHGKFLIAGSGPNDSGFIARYTSDGKLDTRFSQDGVVHRDGGTIADLTLAGPDQLLAANETGVVRYHLSKGTLDNAFGKVGFAAISAPDMSLFTRHLAVRSDGKIIVGGDTNTGSGDSETSDAFLLRLNANGSIDKSFGRQGITIEDADDFDVLLAVQVLPDNQILTEIGGESGDSFLVTIDKNGKVPPIDTNSDRTEFGPDGGVIEDYVRRADGSFLVTGESDFEFEDESPAILVQRLKPNLSLDNKFSGDGEAGPFHGAPQAIALTPQGDIIVAGASDEIFVDPFGFASGKAILLKLKGN